MFQIWRVIASAIVVSVLILSDARASDAGMAEGVDMQAPFAPQVSVVGGERQLTYELYLTSYARKPVSIDGLTVLDSTFGNVIHRLGRDELTAAIGHPANRDESLVLQPARRTVVYLTINLADDRAPPSLTHRLDLSPELGSDSAGSQLLGGNTPVEGGPLLTLGPPLSGGPWVAVYDPALERGHRRVIYATSGQSHIPGRHAIDWMRPVGWPNKGEGDDVLAVSDAVVVNVHDGMGDTQGDPARIPLADASGNYICLDLGNGQFAFYEHLLAGLGVHIGDHVRRGQVIAKVGMSGHATTPHLHFHVADDRGPLAAEGLPYALSGTSILGSYASADDFFAGHPWKRAAVLRSVMGLPPPSSVVSFYEDRAAASQAGSEAKQGR